MSDKAISPSADSQAKTQGEATKVIGPDVDAETIIMGESPPAIEDADDNLVPADSQAISFGTPPGLFEDDSQQPPEAHDTMSKPDGLWWLRLAENADTSVQGESFKDELRETQHDTGVPAESEPTDSQPIGSEPADSPKGSPPGPEEEGESEGHDSDEELTGFLTMDDSGNVKQHGHVSGYSLQLMRVVEQMLDNGPASSSSLAPPQNPGSRAARRARRNERKRKINKKNGNWGAVVAEG